MEIETQTFTITQYQKNVLNVFVYQQFCSILFLEQVKTIIILKYFLEECKYVIKEKNNV